MRTGLATAAALLLLGGCVSFLPTYDEAVYDKLDAAVSDLDKVRAAITVPYQPAPTFKEVEPLYISALGGIVAAERTAEARAGSLERRQPSSESAGLVVAAIRSCRQSVEAIMARHQRGERVDAFVFDNSLVARNCQIPAMMEARLKR